MRTAACCHHHHHPPPPPPPSPTLGGDCWRCACSMVGDDCSTCLWLRNQWAHAATVPQVAAASFARCLPCSRFCKPSCTGIDLFCFLQGDKTNKNSMQARATFFPMVVRPSAAAACSGRHLRMFVPQSRFLYGVRREENDWLLCTNWSHSIR